MFTVRLVADTSRAKRQLEQVAQSDDIASESLKRHMNEIALLFREKTPKDTGELSRGWDSKVSSSPGNQVGELFNRKPNAESIFNFLRRGTKPHIIRPKKAKVMAWEGPAGTIFAKLVKHPGTKAVPALGKSLEKEVARVMESLITDIRRKIAERANKA